MTFVAVASIVLYLAATWQLGNRLLTSGGTSSGPHPVILLAPALLGLGLHGVTLYDTALVGTGLRLSFFNALSLIGWVVAALVLVTLRGRTLDNLALFVLPLTAICVALAALFPAPDTTAVSQSIGLQVHITVSVLGYGLLALAALQAALVALQDRLLRRKQVSALLRALPPLTRQESLLFQLIGAGFFFLSLSLASGAMYVQDLMGQHLLHKTVLSALAWCIFGALLYGRWRHGWRGRPVVRWCLGAFISLMLAYFGAKLVLEVILGRTWSG
ncbi:MAG: cytochrome c biogenesis protein CcsA [Pseudomonadota bacterium]